jgi:hypothetical protein
MQSGIPDDGVGASRLGIVVAEIDHLSLILIAF